VTSLGLGFHFGSKRTTLPPSRRADERQVAKEDYDDEDEDEGASDGDLASIQAGIMDQCKLVRCRFRCLPQP
jgi:hypothetical protein